MTTAPALAGYLRDPLQAQPTPFEILGVEPSAAADDVERALARRLAAARTSTERAAAVGARTALRDTVKRKLAMAFLYEPQALERLDPCPLRDTAALSKQRRHATATAWEEQLRQRFPDPAAAHSLAVLWYWTAVSGAGEGFAAAWERAIGYWAMVVAADDFWPGDVRVDPSTRGEVRLKIVERLRRDVLADADRRREAPSAVALQDVMDSEVRSAYQVASAGLRIDGRRVCVGWRLAAHLRLTERLSAHGTIVALALSPHEAISELLAEGRTATATAEIERQVARAGYDPDLADLHAFALLAAGRRHTAAGDARAAVDCCESALGLANAPALRAQIVEALVAACREAGRDMEPDLAVGFLDERLAVVPDRRLALQLADVLFTRGIARMNATLRSADSMRSDLGGLAASLQANLDDIERAAGLGLERATQQTGPARSRVAEIHNEHSVALVEQGISLRDEIVHGVLAALPFRGTARCAICNAAHPEYTLGPKEDGTLVCRSHVGELQRSLANADARTVALFREARGKVDRAIELDPRDVYLATRREIDELIRLLTQPPPPPPPPAPTPQPRQPRPPASPYGGVADQLHAYLAEAGMTLDDLDPATRHAVESVLIAEGDPYGDLQRARSPFAAGPPPASRRYDGRSRVERIRDGLWRFWDSL